jgi:tRNA(Arg) A34 adenosine deaminase TadA
MIDQPLLAQWRALPAGPRAALDAQWAGIVAGALPCGCAITDPSGTVIAAGRNHVYDQSSVPRDDGEPLRFTRLAHAELNAIGRLPTDLDHAALVLWATQHPCAMCAAAIAFTGIGRVVYLADDLSDDASPSVREATRAGVPYTPFDDALWWTVSNLLFVYGSVAMRGPATGNLVACRAKVPALADLVLQLSADDVLGHRARNGTSLIDALAPSAEALLRVARDFPPKSKTAPGANAPQDG